MRTHVRRIGTQRNGVSSRGLVYFPHAGSFGLEASELAAGLDAVVHSVVLSESSAASHTVAGWMPIELLVDEIASEVAGLAFDEILLLGHSFGASLAFHVMARLLQTSEASGRFKLVLSGAKPFQNLLKSAQVLDDRAALGLFLESTGTDTPIADDPLVLQECLNQINLHLHYQSQLTNLPSKRLIVAAHVVRSADDAMMSAADATGWCEHFDCVPIQHTLAPCGHLYIRDALPAYLNVIQGVLNMKVDSPSNNRPEVLILPFAAASSFLLRGLAQRLEAAAPTRVYELPGHGMRFEEDLLQDTRSVVDDILAWIGPDPRPRVLFGHCLGAFLAVEVRQALQAKGIKAAIVFSGYISSPVSQGVLAQLLDGDKASMQALYLRKGLIRADEIPDGMEEYVCDIIWADSRLMADLLLRKPIPFAEGEVPRVLWGEDDPLFALYGASTDTVQELVPGGHLYFLDDASPVLNAVQRAAAALV